MRKRNEPNSPRRAPLPGGKAHNTAQRCTTLTPNYRPNPKNGGIGLAQMGVSPSEIPRSSLSARGHRAVPLPPFTMKTVTCRGAREQIMTASGVIKRQLHPGLLRGSASTMEAGEGSGSDPADRIGWLAARSNNGKPPAFQTRSEAKCRHRTGSSR